MLVAGGAAALLLPARYSATTALIVDSQRPRSGAEPVTSSEDMGYVETQILTIASDLVLMPVVREFRLHEDPEFARRGSDNFAVIRSLLPDVPSSAALGPEDQLAIQERAALVMLQRRVRVRRIGTSLVVEISVTSADSQKAALIANNIAGVFIDDQRRMSTQITGRAEPRSMARIIEPAMPPLERSGPGIALVLLLSAIVGLAGGVIVAAIRAALDRRLRAAGEVEIATGLPCLVVIPRVRQPRLSRRGPRKDERAGEMRGSAGHGLLSHVLDQPSSPFTGALRLLGSLLDEIRRKDRAVVVGISAPRIGSGRTTVAANLAVLNAERGSRTLLINADYLASDLDRLAGEKFQAWAPRSRQEKAGGTDLSLAGQVGGSVDVVAFGGVPGGTPQSTSPTWLVDVVSQQGKDYDTIIVDLPVLNLSSEARALTGPLDALLLIVASGTTDGEDLLDRLRVVREPEAKQIAIVLNKA
jgi:capsular polysaccharide biosynthesis protein/Mrp family chromosome partitioning ATPase